MEVRLHIDYNGKTYTGDWSDVSKEDYDRLIELIEDPKEINYISIQQGGNPRYFFRESIMISSIYIESKQ